MARIAALAAKDRAELVRQPGTMLPPLAVAAASIVPAFLVAVLAPALSRESLSASPEFAEMADRAAGFIAEIATLEGDARIQSLLFHQFSTLLLIVPVVGAMAIAAHAIIGEKMARTLEPLLATPLSTAELLAAKVQTPLAFSLAIMWGTLFAYVAGIAWLGEPGVWRTFVGGRALLMFVVVGPLLTCVSLLLAVIISSRVNDPRTAQQLGALIVVPITAVFLGQLIGHLVLSNTLLFGVAVLLVALNIGLLAVGVRVFDRERILTRWK